MTEVDLSPVEEQAYRLAEAALMLDRSRSAEAGASAIMNALDNNLQAWIGFALAVAAPECGLAEPVRQNIERLKNFVADQSLRIANSPDGSSLDTLININLQISEGLLEGQKSRATA